MFRLYGWILGILGAFGGTWLIGFDVVVFGGLLLIVGCFGLTCGLVFGNFAVFCVVGICCFGCLCLVCHF